MLKQTWSTVGMRPVEDELLEQLDAADAIDEGGAAKVDVSESSDAPSSAVEEPE